MQLKKLGPEEVALIKHLLLTVAVVIVAVLAAILFG